MAELTRSALKAFFETGDIPTQAEFASFVDSVLNLTDDDTDDLDESATKKFLDSDGAPQVIPGNKSFSGQVKGGAATVTFSTTMSFSANSGNFLKTVVTSNMTSLAITNKINGMSYWIVLEIGGSGSYDIPEAEASFGTRTDNSVDDSAADWFPTTVGSKIIYTIGVDADGDTFYSIETITV